jgi:hypothetical protein
MKVRVINKTRFYTFAAVVLMTIAFMFVVAIANDTPNIVGYNTYVVSNGDTLWDIAEMSNGYGRMDVREIVYDIRDASNITPNIQLGDVVQIPIYEED